MLLAPNALTTMVGAKKGDVVDEDVDESGTDLSSPPKRTYKVLEMISMPVSYVHDILLHRIADCNSLT